VSGKSNVGPAAGFFRFRSTIPNELYEQIRKAVPLRYGPAPRGCPASEAFIRDAVALSPPLRLANSEERMK
jgi:hypothetical protein